MKKWLRNLGFEILEDAIRITAVWAILKYIVSPIEIWAIPEVTWVQCFVCSTCINLLINQQQITRWQKP